MDQAKSIQVFISYRRDDSLHQSGRLYDRLVGHFGSGHVFKDVDSIPLGIDFREVLTEQVVRCDVLLAVIGDTWLSIAGKRGSRRLDDPGDFVRIEIEAALSREIPVIPVLVGKQTSVPPAEELPESLQGLSYRNGISVRPDPDFHKDMDRLIRGIEQGVIALRERRAARSPEPLGPEVRKTAELKPPAGRPAGSPTTGEEPEPPARPPRRPPPATPTRGSPAGPMPARSGDGRVSSRPVRAPEPVAAPPPLPGRRRPSRPLQVAAAMLGVFLLGVIIYVVTDTGRIKIVVDDRKAVVKIDGGFVRIEDLGEPLTFRAGEHALDVTWGDGRFETRKFIVRRGDDERLRVEFEPIVRKEPTNREKKDNPPARDDGQVAAALQRRIAEEKKAAPPDPAPTTKRDSAVPPKPDPGAIVSSAPPKEITNTIGMKLVLIPKGEFLMGSDGTDPDAYDDEFLDKEAGKKEKHRVRITKPFYLGATEVTRGQFRQFVNENDYRTNTDWEKVSFEQTDEHPVVNVSWKDAVAFATWLSRKEGQTYRLPTEAEWEYACRAGTTTRYSFGDDASRLGEYACFSGNSGNATHPVGRHNPNAWGLFDMHGNVYEWCSDGYAAHYYKRSRVDDPPGPDGAADRVVRGGGWSGGPRGARSAFRYGNEPGFRGSYLGFRLAREQSVR